MPHVNFHNVPDTRPAAKPIAVAPRVLETIADAAARALAPSMPAGACGVVIASNRPRPNGNGTFSLASCGPLNRDEGTQILFHALRHVATRADLVRIAVYILTRLGNEPQPA